MSEASAPQFGSVWRDATGVDRLVVGSAPDGRARTTLWPVEAERDVEAVATEALGVHVFDDPASARVYLLRRPPEAMRTTATPRGAPAPRVRTAMVLGAGLGTRLRPLTETWPKPAIPFFGAPLICYSFALLANAGIERLVLNTHWLPERMERTAHAEAERLGLTLAVSHEPVIMGTGGGVREARRLIGDEPFLLVNGDAFLSIDLGVLLADHFDRGDAATMAVAPMPPNENFGGVETGPDLVVRAFTSAREANPAHLRWHFLGVHAISPEVFDFIPPEGEQDINRGVYLAMVRAGRPVRVSPTRIGAWADMGTPKRYREACQDLLSGLCDLGALAEQAPLAAVLLAPLRSLLPSQRRFIHPAASVHPTARIEESVVLEGAEVGADAVLRRSVVFPETRIEAGERLEDVIAFGALRLT